MKSSQMIQDEVSIGQSIIEKNYQENNILDTSHNKSTTS